MVLVITEQAKFDELRKSGQAFVLHVGAEWCAACSAVNALLDQSPTSVPKIYVDAEKLPDVAEAFEVEAVPTVLFFRSDSITANAGKTDVVAGVSGAKLPEIQFNLDSLFGMLPKSAFKNLDDYINTLVRRDRVMVLLTGTPTVPRCGFAEKLIGILRSIGLNSAGYKYYDILEDEEICQAIKKFGDWPTYPQLWVDGELVGGLDICADMHAKGQLAPLLVPAVAANADAASAAATGKAKDGSEAMQDEEPK